MEMGFAMATGFNFSYFIYQDSISLPDDILKLGTRNTIPAGSQLANIGDDIHNIYYIVDGKLSLNATSSDGKEKSCMFIIKNMFYGEAHLYTHFLTIFRVVAVVDTTYVSFTIPQAKHLIETSQEFRMIFINAQAQKIRSMTGEIVSMMIHTPEERVLHYLMDQSTYVQEKNGVKELRISQQSIADALGMHRVTVANALSSLRRAGYLACARNSITLLRPE